MRLRSCRVACGLARSSSGAASAVVALCAPFGQLLGVRRAASGTMALLSASFIAAVVITASSRPAAVQARPRAGLDRASSRQRSNVPAPIPTSRATTSIDALSGGSNRATALSLNVCPYRAKSVLHRRPAGWSMEATTILTRGGTAARCETRSRLSLSKCLGSARAPFGLSAVEAPAYNKASWIRTAGQRSARLLQHCLQGQQHRPNSSCASTGDCNACRQALYGLTCIQPEVAMAYATDNHCGRPPVRQAKSFTGSTPCRIDVQVLIGNTALSS